MLKGNAILHRPMKMIEDRHREEDAREGRRQLKKRYVQLHIKVKLQGKKDWTSAVVPPAHHSFWLGDDD